MNKPIPVAILYTLTAQPWAALCAAQPAQQAPAPAQPSQQQAAQPAQPVAVKPSKTTPSVGQQFVEHGARNPGTACNSARVDKKGQLDCGMHGKAATPQPK